MKKIQLSKLTSLLSLLFFGLALWLLRRELRDFRYRDIINFFHNLPADRVIMALAFTVLSYLALTGYDALALHYIGKRIAYWKVALASFAGYAFSNTLGMPLFTGTPLRARLYSGWGMTAIDITRVVLFSYITFWLGFIGLSGAAFLLEPIAVPSLLHLPMASARPVGALFLALIAGFVAPSFAPQAAVHLQGAGVRRPAAADGGGADRHRLARLGVRRHRPLRPPADLGGTSPSSTSSGCSCSPRWRGCSATSPAGSASSSR